MPMYLIRAQFLAFEEYEVEAETEDDALELFNNGDAGDGHCIDYQLYFGPFIKPQKDA